MTYYSVDKILEIMKDYHVNRRNLNESKDYASVGVTMYGIESSLPRGNGTSDQVANEALRMIDEPEHFKTIRSDMKYLEDRLYRINNAGHQAILSHRMSGSTIREISKLTGTARSSVDRALIKIAMCISGTD